MKLTSVASLALSVVLACACGGAADDTVIPSTTVVLDPAAQATLVSYSATDGTLVATLPSALADLVPGDVVVSDMVDGVAPRGFLRKVTGSTQAGGQVIVSTAYAGLVDAVDTGTLNAQVVPTADMVDTSMGEPSVTISANEKRRDHIPAGSGLVANFDNTRILGVTLNGSVAFDMHIDAEMVIRNFSLEHFRFVVRIDMDTDLTLDGTLRLPVPGVGGDVSLYTIYFTPIVFAIGPIPIVITPRLNIGYGMKVTASATVAGLHLENSTTAQVGTDYTPATGWVDQSFGNGTGSTEIDAFPRINLKLDAYAWAQLAFMLYDSIGPYIWTNQGLVFDIATPRDPFFRVGAHIKGGLGGRINLAPGNLLNLVDFAPALLDVTAYFFASPNTPPFLTMTTPLDGDYSAIGHATPLIAGAFDLEDGPLGDSIQWTSDLDGDLGTGATPPIAHLYRTGPGDHAITASVTDSDSVTTTQTVHVTVMNTPPVATIQAPNGRNQVYLGTSRSLVGAASSPFVTGDACAAGADGWTFLWTSTGVGTSDLITDSTSCLASITFGGDPGPRSLTLRVSDPWPSPLGLDAFRTVIVNAQPRPSDVFTFVYVNTPVSSPPYEADSNGVLPAPLVLSATVLGPPTPVGAITYTWSAVSYNAALEPGPERFVGTGNNLSWQPTSTPGLVDAMLNSQRIDIYLQVADTAANHGDAIQPITLNYAPE